MYNSLWQATQKNSLISRLDFRSKLVMVIVITLIAFTWESPITSGILTILVALACLFSGIKLNYLATILKFMLPFYLFLLLTMGFFNIEQVKVLTNKSELTALLSIKGFTLTLEGILYGLSVIFKTLTMILVIPLGIFTTDLNQMIVGLTKIKVPYKIVFIFSSTLRLFPLLAQELEGIIDAQKLRGLSIEKMGLLRKARVYAAIAIPLILNAMVKSQKMEIVLQTKAFSGDNNRTYLSESKLSEIDYAFIIFFIILLIIVLVLYIVFGVGKFWWLLK